MLQVPTLTFQKYFLPDLELVNNRLNKNLHWVGMSPVPILPIVLTVKTLRVLFASLLSTKYYS